MRRRSSRRNLSGPAVRTTSTSSPNGSMPARGVASGIAAISSGVSQASARTIISSRSSPSKKSPTYKPSPSARDTCASTSLFQPASAIRRSSGTSRNSGSASSSPGDGVTLASGHCFFKLAKPALAASSKRSRSRPWISISTVRPPREPPNNEDCLAKAMVSGKPRIALLMTPTSSFARLLSAARAPMKTPPL